MREQEPKTCASCVHSTINVVISRRRYSEGFETEPTVETARCLHPRAGGKVCIVTGLYERPMCADMRADDRCGQSAKLYEQGAQRESHEAWCKRVTRMANWTMFGPKG